MPKSNFTLSSIQRVLLIVSILFAQQIFAQPGMSPPLDVNVINEPTVNVGNSNLPVTVQNSSSAPIPVQSVAPTRVPFQASDSSPVNTGSFIIDISVPAGTDRLVIEQVHGRAVLGFPTDGIRLATLTVTSGGLSTSHFLNMEHMSTTGFGDNWVINHHPVRLYADPGSVVRLLVTGDPVGSVNIFGNLSISGYLIPANSQSLAP